VSTIARIALVALLLETTTWTTASAAGAVGPLNRGGAASAKNAPSSEMGNGPSPLNQLRESDAALTALLRKRVPSWSPESGLAQDRLRRLLASLLDYRKMAERVMGKSWQLMDGAQQKLFVDVFATLTNQAYVSAAARPVGRVRYLSEKVSGSEARVSATAEQPSSDHPTSDHSGGEQRLGQIEYRLSRSDDRWLIYDVVVDGVSLTESYQDQLQSVLRREGFDELIARMRRRAEARPRD